jgi:hypothetical protein
MPVEDFAPNIFAITGTTTIPKPPRPVFAMPIPIAQRPIMIISKELRSRECKKDKIVKS